MLGMRGREGEGEKGRRGEKEKFLRFFYKDLSI